jgi:hypothetical protein
LLKISLIKKVLLEKNLNKLPLFYHKIEETEVDCSSLEEFIVNCLLDSTFPRFVDKVEKTFCNLMKSELN